ncbi:MAG: YdcF family protein [Anaerolineae bacterium]|nr:YdcF family protein [Anaerolineae bacterium]
MHRHFVRPLLLVVLGLLLACLLSTPVTAQGPAVTATTTDELAVFVEPNPDAETLGTLAPASTVPVTARATGTDGQLWLRITFQQREGWIARDAVVLTGDLETVPLLQPALVLDEEILSVLSPLLALMAPLRDIVGEQYTAQIYLDVNDVPPGRVTIVFSAGVHNAAPNQLGLDRLDTAIDLYQAGLTEQLHMAGNSREHLFDQPGAMAGYAIARGIPAEAITLDRDSFTTGETCRRAREVYEFEQVVLVTQAYHLPRALLLCEAAGLDAVGLVADRRVYENAAELESREALALPLAILDILTQNIPEDGPQDE